MEPLDMLHCDSYGCEPTEQNTSRAMTETSSPTTRRANHEGKALKVKGRPVRRAHLHDQARLTDHHLNPRVAVVASLAPALPMWTIRPWFQRPLLGDDAVGVSWPASVVGG